MLKALGQENIDDLLKLSEDYKKGESLKSTCASEEPETDPNHRRARTYHRTVREGRNY